MTETIKWHDAYLGLGSNLDNPLQHLHNAVQDIAASAEIQQKALSPLYQSEPVGPANQPDYINAVMHIETTLTPLALLHKLQTIENLHGRIRNERWGARTLDLDILLYDDQIINLAELSVPHPEMTKRSFVLRPLADIAPSDLVIPGHGNLLELLTACPQNGLHRLTS
jgi:2-amino-4-hydroxy-6-hydroxymethyldihydropteridine diphosphokinase